MQLLRIAGVIACVVVFSVAYVVGQNAQNKRQKNMQVRLELVKDRFKHCDAERRLLRGEGKRTDEDDLRIAMQEQAALVSENQLLTEDNEKLREEIQELEDQVDELRESLNDKDFVTDDEVAQLQATMDLGNNSQALQEVLSEAQMSFGVSKDDLIAKLLAELQRKRTALRGCKRKLGAESGKPEENTDAKADGKNE